MRVVSIACSLGIASACGKASFGCTEDAQCSAPGGVCAAPGYCAFPNDACVSGLEFGQHAANELAGECVPQEAGSGGDDDDGDPPPPPSSSDVDADGDGDGGTTLAVDDTGASSSEGSSSVGAETVSGSGDVTSSGDGGSSSTGGSSSVLTFPADFATCAYTDLAVPDPEACESAAAGDVAFTVDAVEGTNMGSAAGFLAFTLDDALAGREVLEVRLVTHVVDNLGSDSIESGEVWQVQPFTLEELAMTLPTPIGNGPIAASIGVVAVDGDAVWTLPIEVLGAQVHLAINPVTSDGVDYYREEGAVPPVLEVEVAP